MNKRINQKNKRKVWLLLSLGSLVIVGLGFFGIVRISGVEKVGLKIRMFIWGAKLKVTEKRREVILQRKIDVLELEVARLKFENETLRKQLEAPLPPDLELIPARVVGFSRFLYIDKGRKDGIKIGSAVIAEQILVGHVIKVGNETSKVRLLSDPESKIPVRTVKGALGLIVGDKGEFLKLEMVLQKEKLEEGDLVATSGGPSLVQEQGSVSEEDTVGLESWSPKDLLIGRVVSILSSEKEVFKRAEVEPAIEYDRLLQVFVIR